MVSVLVNGSFLNCINWGPRTSLVFSRMINELINKKYEMLQVFYLVFFNL